MGEGHLAQTCKRTSQQYPVKLKMYIPFNLVTPLLGIETLIHIHEKKCSLMKTTLEKITKRCLGA